MYLAKASSMGSLKFLPINCRLKGSPFLDNLMGIETAGTPARDRILEN